MASLAEIVKNEMAWYAADGFDLEGFLLTNEAQQVYSVNIVDFDAPNDQFPADVVVMAGVMGDYVVIFDDRTDKPFIDRLVAAGVPREKIIRAYAGDPLPYASQE